MPHSGYGANIRLMTESGLLLADMDRVRLAARKKYVKEIHEIAHESDLQTMVGSCNKYDYLSDRSSFFANDCIYTYTCTQSCARQGEIQFPYEYTFYSDNDGLPLVGSTIKTTSRPQNILKEVRNPRVYSALNYFLFCSNVPNLAKSESKSAQKSTKQNFAIKLYSILAT